LAGLCVVSAVLAIAFLIPHIRNTTVCFALILAILGLAVKWGRAEAVASSVLAALGFAYYFQPPIGSFAISPEGWVATACFLITALWVSHLSLKAKTGEREAIARRLETERLYELGQSLLGADRLETVAWTVINRMAPIFGVKGAAFCFVATGEVHRADSDTCAIADDQLLECARNQAVFVDAARDVYITPLQVCGKPVGSLGVCGMPFSETLLKSVGHLVAVVLERAQAAETLANANQELVRQNEVIEKERKTSEALLLNILPADVAHELRMSGMVAPKYFEDVTIVFTDFVGFTLSTEKLAAEELVTNLHEYFTAFDKICARYQLEKMKTIGDAYMCIGGLPARNPAHPVNAVMAALEMIQEVKRRDRPENSVHWKMRVGVHTGPVIAGVVGINKFAFDIWGDTVNFSARMESSGAPNRLNISERTYSRVKDFFDCEYRGKVLTKEKREFDMYFVNGILPALMDNSGEIPPRALVRRYNIYFQKDPPSFPAFLAHPEETIAPAPGTVARV
jgi:class 3 adenylate cyclase